VTESVVNSAKILLEIGEDEAILLFELLADFSNQASLEIPAISERLALVRLHGALEKTLVVPFAKNYLDVLSAARKRLADQSGKVESQ
jgi:hypothetical protein